MYDMVRTEPAHLHVATTKGRTGTFAKIWLETIEFAELGDLTKRQQKLVQRLVKANQAKLIEQYGLVQAGQRPKTITLKPKK